MHSSEGKGYMKSSASGLGARLQRIVNLYYHGSVNEAANSLGIDQSTLSRIVTGVTRNPRLEVLQRIVDHSLGNIGLEWLLSGRGEEPSPLDSQGRPTSGAVWRFVHALRALPLKPEVVEAMTMLPYAPLLAAYSFRPVDFDSAEDYLAGTLSYASEAIDASVRAWATILEGGIQQLGAAAVAAALNRDFEVGVMGYTVFARLYAHGREAEIRSFYQQMLSSAAPTTAALSGSKRERASDRRPAGRRRK